MEPAGLRAAALVGEAKLVLSISLAVEALAGSGSDMMLFSLQLVREQAY